MFTKVQAFNVLGFLGVAQNTRMNAQYALQCVLFLVGGLKTYRMTCRTHSYDSDTHFSDFSTAEGYLAESSNGSKCIRSKYDMQKWAFVFFNARHEHLVRA